VEHPVLDSRRRVPIFPLLILALFALAASACAALFVGLALVGG
jgi:hypothetical protein